MIRSRDLPASAWRPRASPGSYSPLSVNVLTWAEVPFRNDPAQRWALLHTSRYFYNSDWLAGVSLLNTTQCVTQSKH